MCTPHFVIRRAPALAVTTTTIDLGTAPAALPAAEVSASSPTTTCCVRDAPPPLEYKLLYLSLILQLNEGHILLLRKPLKLLSCLI